MKRSGLALADPDLVAVVAGLVAWRSGPATAGDAETLVDHGLPAGGDPAPQATKQHVNAIKHRGVDWGTIHRRTRHDRQP